MTQTSDTPWSLLRIWHVEVLSSVAGNARAVTFTRTSYCIAPSRWRALPEEELDRRVNQLVDASYARRNHQMAQTQDPTPMWMIAFDREWVGEPDAGTRAMVSKQAFAPELVDRALAELDTLRATPRPGLDARPWRDAFTAWRVDESDDWHILKYADRDAAFALLAG